MDNQYTPTYHRMWNCDFSLLIIAEILLCTSCYMTIPFLPCRLYCGNYINSECASLTMVVFVIGICLSGFFGCWLIQRYRRNKVFFVSALCQAATIIAISIFDTSNCEHSNGKQIVTLMCICIFGGFAFGHAKRVLSCTLLIDKTESCHRTEANYAAIWISRLMVVIGPIVALVLHGEVKNSFFYGVGAGAAFVSAVLILAVKFPFRAPEEGTKIISIDRFFLPRGWNIATVVALMSGALGITMMTHLSMVFFSSLVVGFFIAIIILRYSVVRSGRYTSVVGNICIIVALAAMMLHNGILDDTLKPMVLSIGFGLTSSEQLYKLLDRCDHCQRSTAESTYFMASDGGFFLGVAVSWCKDWSLSEQATYGEGVAICLFAASALICSVNALAKKHLPGHHA